MIHQILPKKVPIPLSTEASRFVAWCDKHIEIYRGWGREISDDSYQTRYTNDCDIGRLMHCRQLALNMKLMELRLDLIEPRMPTPQDRHEFPGVTRNPNGTAFLNDQAMLARYLDRQFSAEERVSVRRRDYWEKLSPEEKKDYLSQCDDVNPDHSTPVVSSTLIGRYQDESVHSYKSLNVSIERVPSTNDRKLEFYWEEKVWVGGEYEEETVREVFHEQTFPDTASAIVHAYAIVTGQKKTQKQTECESHALCETDSENVTSPRMSP